MQQFYSSGSFARKARVSLRTIRYYDKIDLHTTYYYIITPNVKKLKVDIYFTN